MRKNFPGIAIFCVSLALLFFGCSRKTDTKSDLEKAANSFARTEPAATPSRPAAQTPQPAQPAPAPAEVPATPAQEVNQALVSYKSGNFEDAVTRLQKLRATPVMTPEQRIALNDAMASVMTEIYTLAAKGDDRAIQAVKRYETLQTQRQ